jgi:hypothetical protein
MMLADRACGFAQDPADGVADGVALGEGVADGNWPTDTTTYPNRNRCFPPDVIVNSNANT